MIEVAAGVLTDARGRVLLMQRLPGTHLAGTWEFPGGKLESGEGIEQALTRELREELGIEARAFSPLISLPWRYPQKTVRLHVLRVTDWHGELLAREGHPLRWVDIHDIDANIMPAADRPVVAALRLSDFYIISPPGLTQHAEVMGWLRPLVGKRRDPLLQLRLPHIGRASLREILDDALATESNLRRRLLVNHDVEMAREFGIGVHLRAAQLRELHQRPLPGEQWVGASCHNAGELERAAEIGADFATLSPVCATGSHPDATPLGWEAFARLIADARLPVYALGGVRADDLDRLELIGAQGLAGISAFARLPDA